MDRHDQLSRTQLLLGGDLGIVESNVVLQALARPVITLTAEESTVRTLAGQVAISTAAMLAARSGHQVFVNTPDTPLIGYQPPMVGSSFHEGIVSVADTMIDGVRITLGLPQQASDITFVFGPSPQNFGRNTRRVVSVGCSNWSADFVDFPRQAQWTADSWPIGALAAAFLVAAETFKISGRALLPLSSRAAEFAATFNPVGSARFTLAPEDTPLYSNIGEFDLISAGAVTNAFLFSLLRVPELTGSGRAYDRDISDQTNRNRNMLLLPEWVDEPKVALFELMSRGMVKPIPRHFEERDLGDLASQVVVGVDDIPTRWLLARAGPAWMGVGATTHFKCMASVHFPYSGCAACLHPHDEQQEGPVPTVSFVSFAAGLMVGADLLRNASGTDVSFASRQTFLEPFHPSTVWRTPVATIPTCRAECSASRIKPGLR